MDRRDLLKAGLAQKCLKIRHERIPAKAHCCPEFWICHVMASSNCGDVGIAPGLRGGGLV